MSWNTTTTGGRYLWRLSPLELQTTSGKALLRPLDEADADELHALIEENRPLLSRWLSWAAGQTPEDTIEFLRRTRAQLEGNDGFQAAIVVDDSIAGVIGYRSVDWPQRSTSLGYWLGERHQGKGTMTEAARALVDHAISVWDLNRVEIRAAVDNAASRAIPERLGFREEGTLREAEFADGRYQDLAVYSILAAEWRERR
jgi:ribosomal-protein-serine acetyltransferase